MPVPKRKTSKSRRDKRQSCKFIRPKAFTACSNCSECLNPHQACLRCGFYKGRKIITTKLDRTVRRASARHEAHARATAAPEGSNDQQS